MTVPFHLFFDETKLSKNLKHF